MQVCHETIYLAVYQPGSLLAQPTRVSSVHHPSPLRTGRDHCRAQRRAGQRRVRFGHPMLSVHERSFPPDDRSQAGHWEGDLIVGRGHTSVSATCDLLGAEFIACRHRRQPRGVLLGRPPRRLRRTRTRAPRLRPPDRKLASAQAVQPPVAARLLDLSLDQHPTQRRVPRLLRPQARRGQAAQPCRHRPTQTTRQRPLGHAPRQSALRGTRHLRPGCLTKGLRIRCCRHASKGSEVLDTRECSNLALALVIDESS